MPEKKYQTAKDILIPKGTRVVRVSKMSQQVNNMATVLMGVGKNAHYDWLMYFEDAVATGMIEEVDHADAQ